MKKGIHPTTYQFVVFQDETAGFSFLTKSTATSAETVVWEDGKEYPLVKMHISSASHPFFTGEEKIIDTEGRVDRFAAKLKAAAERKDALANKAKKAQKAASKAKENIEKEIGQAAKKVAKTVAKTEKKVEKEVKKVKDAAK